MSKFKVGDRIRLNKDSYSFAKKGCVGVVTGIKKEAFRAWLDDPCDSTQGLFQGRDDGLHWYYCDREADLIKA